MARVFLSYARPDADCAARLAGLLADAGHQIWWDRELQGGARFASEIDRALRDAEAVVVLWSEASVRSVWVQDEAAEGRDSGKLVPVVIESVRPPLGFRQFHSIELADLGTSPAPRNLAEVSRAIDALSASAKMPAADPATVSAPEPAAGPSICVLPFVNMSGEPEQEYFSDGITEDIITDLSKISALSVVARNTAFQFKGRALDVKQVAKAVGARHVLEGSVRKAGGRVRISAQLIDGLKGDHVWAERYDRDMTDIFTIQDEISQAIVGALKVKLLPEEQTSAVENRGTSSVEAYNLYLMARQMWVSGSYGSLRRDETIVRICRRATTIDPDYAQAWALLALAQAELRFWHGKDDDALAAAKRALAINPRLAEPHCVLARYREEEGSTEAAHKDMAEALRLDPDSWEVNREAARLIIREGRWRDSIPYLEKATSVTDADWHNPSLLCICYRELGDEANLRRMTKLAFERIERSLAKDPTNGAAIAMGIGSLVRLGEEARARDWVQRGLLLDPDNLSMLYNMACSVEFALHDSNMALDILEQFLERTTSVAHLRHLNVDPDLDGLRDKPRFKAMVAAAKERLGQADES